MKGQTEAKSLVGAKRGDEVVDREVDAHAEELRLLAQPRALDRAVDGAEEKHRGGEPRHDGRIPARNRQ